MLAFSLANNHHSLHGATRQAAALRSRDVLAMRMYQHCQLTLGDCVDQQGAGCEAKRHPTRWGLAGGCESERSVFIIETCAVSVQHLVYTMSIVIAVLHLYPAWTVECLLAEWAPNGGATKWFRGWRQ